VTVAAPINQTHKNKLKKTQNIRNRDERYRSIQSKIKVKYKTIYMYIYNTHAYTTHNTNDKSNTKILNIIVLLLSNSLIIL